MKMSEEILQMKMSKELPKKMSKELKMKMSKEFHNEYMYTVIHVAFQTQLFLSSIFKT